MDLAAIEPADYREFRQKTPDWRRAGGLARMLDASRPLGDDEGRSIQADEGRFAARGMAAGTYPTVPRE
ncbi:hypothetical protein [Burkholderia cenocepacia]|uniref:hypothetical protein n=1 Tax=Burkholderia cenocepacia TaxID=95486 RepID=UPI00054E2E68|nr:hypothetical protein [Burkholderia cenocepacia]MBR8210575.1 hypothetical protein [Burkholderia cenocepacia]MCA8233569.1 hypothetical protein [Burkholderia cenocepacia]HEM7887638.1 hypothetical protein [Burkholderia cenocepacia]